MSEEEKEKETHKIIVDRRPHDWHQPFITGADIKRLAGVDQATFDAWQDVPGPEDVLVADDRKVDLRERGTEKFFTGKKTTTEG
ncbi:multiubiquitin domain-containing protein [Mesorhizobium sp. M0761]|uniref:multiubiquitin domain-containing protein n=1 Tax=Mesorhizobium sp. M0761 TaxID=2956994 RepID=UPI0033398379